MTTLGRSLVLAALIGTAGLSSACAQAGGYGTEDGYGGDGIGWGPAYRRDTTFRPAVGFYGGVERPNPYAPQAGITGTLGEPGLSPRPKRARPAASVRRPAVRQSRASRPGPSRIR